MGSLYSHAVILILEHGEHGLGSLTCHRGACHVHGMLQVKTNTDPLPERSTGAQGQCVHVHQHFMLVKGSL